VKTPTSVDVRLATLLHEARPKLISVKERSGAPAHSGFGL
jgi:hypothetical protein